MLCKKACAAIREDPDSHLTTWTWDYTASPRSGKICYNCRRWKMISKKAKRDEKLAWWWKDNTIWPFYQSPKVQRRKREYHRRNR